MDQTVEITHRMLASQPVDRVRSAIRQGRYTGHTAGLAPGKLQVNLAILPTGLARDFEAFCRTNPRPCPLIGVTSAGRFDWHELGKIDVRTDAPAYNIYRDGVFEQTRKDVCELWRGDLVAFALGCSFTFETALAEAGIPMAHVEADRTVPMYRTTIPLQQAGPFGGGMVVSLRFVSPERVEEACAISAQYPWAHGAPIHVGDPGRIGIRDIRQPDWGDPPVSTEGTAMFWACGVTPQNALAAARPPFCITHRPGHMLITDIDDRADSMLA